MTITGIEAHFLLSALDEYLKTDYNGQITQYPVGWPREKWQELRDRLFAAHEHPPEEETNG